MAEYTINKFTYSGNTYKLKDDVSGYVTGSGTQNQLAAWNSTKDLKGGPKITYSTTAPTSNDGANGDIWFVYNS